MTKTLLKPAVILVGTLDLAYVAWVVVGSMQGSGLADLWQTALAFGLPHPSLQAAAAVILHVAIVSCGLALIFQRPRLAWLNYVLFPFRVLLVLPTFFPLFWAVSSSASVLPPVIPVAALVLTEAFRVILIYRWSRHASAAVSVAGAAA
jgi:hypothetical protein